MEPNTATSSPSSNLSSRCIHRATLSCVLRKVHEHALVVPHICPLGLICMSSLLASTVIWMSNPCTQYFSNANRTGIFTQPLWKTTGLTTVQPAVVNRGYAKNMPFTDMKFINAVLWNSKIGVSTVTFLDSMMSTFKSPWQNIMMVRTTLPEYGLWVTVLASKYPLMRK